MSASESDIESRAGQAVARRYRAPAATFQHWNDTLEILISHRSIRRYTVDPLPEGSLDLLVAAAQSASTSSNLQTWSVVAVEDAERKNRLAALAGNQRCIERCPTFLVWLCDLDRMLDMSAKMSRPVIGPHYLEMMLVGVIDATLAAQNAMVAAESLGLGAVYIGGIRNHPQQVAAELCLPSNVFAAFGMCVGVPDPKFSTDVKPRLPPRAVLHHEQYDLSQRHAAIDEYVPRLEEFQREQGMPVASWIDLVLKRVVDEEALHGRDRLSSELWEMGFKML